MKNAVLQCNVVSHWLSSYTVPRSANNMKTLNETYIFQYEYLLWPICKDSIKYMHVCTARDLLCFVVVSYRANLPI